MFRSGPLSPSDAQALNLLASQVAQLSQIRGGKDMDYWVQGSVLTLNPRIPLRMLAQITGHLNADGTNYSEEDCRYSFTEWNVGQPPYTCVGTAVPDGRKGYVDQVPAIEVNGSSDVPDGTIVELFLAPDGSHWRFAPGGTGLFGFIRPDCVITLSQQVCCNEVDGMSAKVWYLVYTDSGTPYYIDNDHDAANLLAIALNYPVVPNSNPPSAYFCGLCPSS